MAKPLVEPGAVIDGFTIGECVHQRRHGDAVDGDPSRHHCAAADEGPAGRRGRGSGGHRQFRDGADDPAAAGGPARAGLFRHRRFRRQPYVVHGAHPRQDAVQPDRRSADPLRRGEGDRRARSRPRWPTCTGRTSSITTSSRAASCSGRSGEARADRFRPVASQPAAGPVAGGIPPALRHRALHGAGAAARRARRSAQRPVFARRAAVFLHHRRAAVRRERDAARHAAAAVARSAIRRASCRPDYPPWLQEIVLRCLEIEPVWRYPTASQLAFELAIPTRSS